MSTEMLLVPIKCTEPATEHIEVYSPRNGLAHGSLDAAVYTCAEHRAPTVAAIHAAQLTASATTWAPTFPGCGASWHGPDGLWVEVVGPHTTSTKEIGMDTTTRTQLDVDEQVRIAALTIASARYPNTDLRSLIDLADTIGEWILSGQLPAAKPGTTY